MEDIKAVSIRLIGGPNHDELRWTLFERFWKGKPIYVERPSSELTDWLNSERTAKRSSEEELYVPQSFHGPYNERIIKVWIHHEEDPTEWTRDVVAMFGSKKEGIHAFGTVEKLLHRNKTPMAREATYDETIEKCRVCNGTGSVTVRRGITKRPVAVRCVRCWGHGAENYQEVLEEYDGSYSRWLVERNYTSSDE